MRYSPLGTVVGFGLTFGLAAACARIMGYETGSLTHETAGSAGVMGQTATGSSGGRPAQSTDTDEPFPAGMRSDNAPTTSGSAATSGAGGNRASLPSSVGAAGPWGSDSSTGGTTTLSNSDRADGGSFSSVKGTA